jgi:hypothetical protein
MHGGLQGEEDPSLSLWMTNLLDIHSQLTPSQLNIKKPFRT